MRFINFLNRLIGFITGIALTLLSLFTWCVMSDAKEYRKQKTHYSPANSYRAYYNYKRGAEQ